MVGWMINNENNKKPKQIDQIQPQHYIHTQPASQPAPHTYFATENANKQFAKMELLSRFGRNVLSFARLLPCLLVGWLAALSFDLLLFEQAYHFADLASKLARLTCCFCSCNYHNYQQPLQASARTRRLGYIRNLLMSACLPVCHPESYFVRCIQFWPRRVCVCVFVIHFSRKLNILIQSNRSFVRRAHLKRNQQKDRKEREKEKKKSFCSETSTTWEIAFKKCNKNNNNYNKLKLCCWSWSLILPLPLFPSWSSSSISGPLNYPFYFKKMQTYNRACSSLLAMQAGRQAGNLQSSPRPRSPLRFRRRRRQADHLPFCLPAY